MAGKKLQILLIFLLEFFNGGKIYIKMYYFNRFSVYSSVTLSALTWLFNHHLHPSLELHLILQTENAEAERQVDWLWATQHICSTGQIRICPVKPHPEADPYREGGGEVMLQKRKGPFPQLFLTPQNPHHNQTGSLPLPEHLLTPPFMN